MPHDAVALCRLLRERDLHHLLPLHQRPAPGDLKGRRTTAHLTPLAMRMRRAGHAHSTHNRR